jgi:hypothetical protein
MSTTHNALDAATTEFHRPNIIVILIGLLIVMAFCTYKIIQADRKRPDDWNGGI